MMDDEPVRILVVDDVPLNVKLLADLLRVQGYEVDTADCGEAALAALEAEMPDLVLLDVMMPDLSGYEVCKRIRSNAASSLLPVVMVTALDPAEERVKGIEAGADDFLSKPINMEELLARVRSLLRIGRLHARNQQQAEQLAEWNRELEARVDKQVAQLTRLQQLSSYLPRDVAQIVVEEQSGRLLEPTSREVAICAVDLRGFTAFSDQARPEQVLQMLGEYYAVIGRIAELHDGTVEHFAGDGMIVLFNAPLEIDDPNGQAVRAARAMHVEYIGLRDRWLDQGYDLGLGIGMASGMASVGAIGYEGFWQYCAIGPVTNLAARLCAKARHGTVLLAHDMADAARGIASLESLGPQKVRGFEKPMQIFQMNVTTLV